MSDYDFRHSRLTHLGHVTDNLTGVMYLAGHTQPATTARYLRPQKQAAVEVLRAAPVGGGGRPSSGGEVKKPNTAAGNILAGFWPSRGKRTDAPVPEPRKAKPRTA